MLNKTKAASSKTATHIPWAPPAHEAAYYTTKTPALTESVVYTSFIQPLTGVSDPTHGRDLLPRSPAEEALRADPKHSVTEYRCLLDGSDAGPVYGARDKSSGERADTWIYYQVWELTEGASTRDIVYCHGVCDYGGNFSSHASHFLDAGYRLIVGDHIGHGRSTGLHGYVPDLKILVDGLGAVIRAVERTDEAHGRTRAQIDARKRFLLGASIGGCTALLYTILNPPTSAPGDAHTQNAGVHTANRITGLLLLCPMLSIAPESLPPKAVQIIGTAVARIAGRVPLLKGPAGMSSSDISLEEQFAADPQTYSGRFRIGTAGACLKAIQLVEDRLANVQVPFKVLHGEQDRVTSYLGSKKLFETAVSADKEMKVYPGEQHELLRAGRIPADHERRAMVLHDMLEWLDRH